MPCCCPLDLPLASAHRLGTPAFHATMAWNHTAFSPSRSSTFASAATRSVETCSHGPQLTCNSLQRGGHPFTLLGLTVLELAPVQPLGGIARHCTSVISSVGVTSSSRWVHMSALPLRKAFPFGQCPASAQHPSAKVSGGHRSGSSYCPSSSSPSSSWSFSLCHHNLHLSTLSHSGPLTSMSESRSASRSCCLGPCLNVSCSSKSLVVGSSSLLISPSLCSFWARTFMVTPYPCLATIYTSQTSDVCRQKACREQSCS